MSPIYLMPKAPAPDTVIPIPRATLRTLRDRLATIVKKQAELWAIQDALLLTLGIDRVRDGVVFDLEQGTITVTTRAS